MKEEKRISDEDIANAYVRLKPLFNIKPEYWLAALFSVILLLILFLLLFLPGIKNNGTVLFVSSDPPGSAVYIDSVWRGSTPCSIFLPSGKAVISIGRQGFESHTQTLAIGGRVFASLFFPKKASFNAKLEPSDRIDRVFISALEDFTGWSLATTPTDAWQIPMVLSDAALALSSVETGTGNPIEMILAGIALSRHSVAMRDALRAGSILSTHSAALSPLGTGVIVKVLEENPAIIAVIVSMLQGEDRKQGSDSALYSQITALRPAAAPGLGKTLEIASMVFVGLDGGEAALETQSAIPAITRLEPFYLSRDVSSAARFREFLAARPFWADRKAVIDAGLADDDYLLDIDSADDDAPVRYISWHAAMAYCSWLDSFAPDGWRFSLPSEIQWAYAAAAALALADPTPFAILQREGIAGPAPIKSLPVDAAGFRGLLGNVWEWTADSWSAHPGILPQKRNTWPTGEYIVRGGSWANMEGSVTLSSRGPMKATNTNAYTGFRPALVKETEQ